MTEPTVWVEIPARWVLPQGEFTFLRDDTRLAFGPVLAIEPDNPGEAEVRTRLAEQFEAAADGMTDNWTRARGIADGLRRAARIARGLE